MWHRALCSRLLRRLQLLQLSRLRQFCRRLRRVHRWSRRLRPTGTRSSSPSRPRRARNCGSRKTCCDTRSPTAMPARSSTGLSRCYSRTWRERNWPRPTGHGRAGVLLPGRVTSQPRSSGRSGSATAGAAHSWAKAAGAATSGPSWNFIMSSRMRSEARRRCRTWSSGVESTTATRPSFSSGHTVRRTVCARRLRRTWARPRMLGRGQFLSREVLE